MERRIEEIVIGMLVVSGILADDYAETVRAPVITHMSALLTHGAVCGNLYVIFAGDVAR